MKTPRTRKDMIAFLQGHFRYSTLNSWNGQGSYAAKVKIHDLNFPDSASRSRAYDLIYTDGVFEEAGVQMALDAFQSRQNDAYTIGMNGRSGGYMVLYGMNVKPDEHKTMCHSCWQKNFEADTKVCGRCHATNMHPYSGTIKSVSSRSIDKDEDFETWDTGSLRSRVRLVMDFDKAVKEACNNFISYCQCHEAEKVIVQVPKKILQAVAVS